MAAYREVKGEILEATEARLLASLMQPEKLEKASANNVAYALRQVSDIFRLTTGQSTHHIGLMTKIIIEADEAYKEMHEKSTT